MSSDALNWAKNVTVGSATKKAVLMVLADYADHEWSCFPSQARIAEEAEVGVRTVRRILTEWEQEGVITRRHRIAKEGRGRTSDRIFLQPASLAARTTKRPGDADQPATECGLSGQGLADDPLENRQEPQELTLVPSPPRSASVERDFDDWWSEYPKDRRQEKAQALIEYRRARATTDAETLLTAIRMFARLVKAQNTETKFIPYAHRWLKKQRWQDEIEEELAEAERNASRSPFEAPPMRFG